MFRSKFLFYLLILLTILLIGTSFVRFMILHDYMVAYEGECNPYTQDCFVGCEDEECSRKYYYSKIQKYAPDVYMQCGEDITDCAEANICLEENGSKCNVTYCDPKIDGDECEALTEADFVEEENEGTTTEQTRAESGEVDTNPSENVTLDESEEGSNELIDI
jgi:hypothetical protein